jgi:HEAT repeat protein
MSSQTKRAASWISFLILLLMQITVSVQGVSASDEAKPDRERDGLKSRLHERVHSFLDSARTRVQRLRALDDIVNPDKQVLSELREIISNRDEDDEVRWAAARKLPLTKEVIRQELQVLKNPQDGGPGLRAKLLSDLSQRVRLPHSSELLAEMHQIIGDLLHDKDEATRVAAFRFLVPMQDARALKLVEMGLEKPDQALIAPDEAIQLLDIAGAGNHRDAIRPYLDAEDVHVRAAAALALGIDPNSHSRLRSIVVDQQQPMEVRLSALRALSGSDKGFADYALSLLRRKDLDPEVRTWCIHRFVGFANYNRISPSQKNNFLAMLETLTAPSAAVPASVKQSADEALAYVRDSKSFGE